MFRRSIVIFSLAMTVCLPALAQGNLFNGKWKIDDRKSSWSDGTFPKNMSLVIDLTVTGDTLKYHSVNDTSKTRAPSVLDYEIPMDGQPHPFAGSSRFNQMSARRLSASELEILEMKDGDVIVGAIWEFSADGKHFVRRGVGKSPTCKSHAYEEFFDKQ